MYVTHFDARGNSSQVEIADNSSCRELVEQLRLTAPNQAVSVLVNGSVRDFTHPLRSGDAVRFLSFDDAQGKEVFWHTSAHVLAQAVLRLFPDARPTIGPPIEHGFYYDFANLNISDADFARIEEEMQAIVDANFATERYVFSSKEEALKRFQNNRYKQELISELPTGQEITGYAQGEFFDLCRGPHMARLGKIKAIKILKNSGAYWRGDSKNEMLTRIYGITFPDRKLLKDYLHAIEEAKKRDHKILGPKLDLFSLKEEAPGMPFIHPHGMIVWNRLLEYWRQCHRRAGYVEIKTPSMMVRELWERSGHWNNYREHMFTSVVEERDFAIKPMNCPGAMLLFKSEAHSYRDLPLRAAEIGQVFRFEPSGSLSGLLRVRSFHQDDAHIFMEPSQIQSEILGILQLVDEIYATFGLTYTLALSTKPDKNTIGTDAEWELATRGLEEALKATGKPFEIHEGEGAFYGPKIDIRLHDALGRLWQCGTIQLDMSLPERFDLHYTASDGTPKRPIMVHRVIYGSIERFLGSLIEFYAGKFPLWLSPRQVCVITVADRHADFAKKTAATLCDQGFEVDVDDSSESVSKKIRGAQLAQYNYILTIGDQEVEHETVSVRTRDMAVHGEVSLSHLLAALSNERAKKSLASTFSRPIA